MKISRRSPLTGITTTLDLPISESEWSAYLKGALIQEALPRLSDDEREFILSGLLPGEFEKYVGPEPED